MEWTEEAISQLKALWKEGHSTAEIGRRMGVTKNAIVGKAHRLVLSSRPSPIRHAAPGGSRRAERSGRTTAPAAPTAPRTSPAGLPGVVTKPSLRHVTPTASYGRILPCCWPIGEPGTKSFRFCDDATLPNKPYCATHAQLAYVKVRDRRDTAA